MEPAAHAACGASLSAIACKRQGKLNSMSKIIMSIVLVLFAHNLMAQKVNPLGENRSYFFTYSQIKGIRATDFMSPIQTDNYSFGIENSLPHNPSIQKLFRNKMIGVKTFSNNQVYRCDTAVAYSTNNTVRFIPSYNANGRAITGLVEKWSNGQWIDSTYDTLSYDSKGHVLTDLLQVWSNGQWTNSSLYTTTYDSRGDLLTYMYQQYSNGQWVNSYLGTSTYNVQGRVLSSLWDSWSNGQLNNSSTESYTYDANGHPLSDLSQRWSNGQYINSSLSTSTFDSSGHDIAWLVQLWSDGQWVNDERDTTTFDANGNELTDMSQQWLNGQWTNYMYSTMTSDSGGHVLSALTQQWLNGQWTNVQFETDTYNTNGNRLTDLFQEWSNGRWVNFYLFTETYDENDNPLSENYKTWSDSSWVQTDTFLEINYGYKYFPLWGYNLEISYMIINITKVSTTTNNIVVRYSVSQNYPNPFNPTTTISFDIPSRSFVSLKIFDILGREVSTIVSGELEAGSYTRRWNARNMASGVYFYRLTAGSFVETKKLILLK